MSEPRSARPGWWIPVLLVVTLLSCCCVTTACLGTLLLAQRTQSTVGGPTVVEQVGPPAVVTSEARRIDPDFMGGAMIAGVTPGSPADAAGLRAEDIIAEIDRTPLDLDALRDNPEGYLSDRLALIWAARPEGGAIEFVVVRDGEKVIASLELGQRPARGEELEALGIVLGPVIAINRGTPGN